MSRFFYIASNGRCGTQFLARQLKSLSPDTHVLHEKNAYQFDSRGVFRDPDRLYWQLGKETELQEFFSDISADMRAGRDFVYLGWPSFAWVQYFQERFPRRFRFVHLVRNPYKNAASHGTHHTMQPPLEDRLERAAKLFATDPGVKLKEFAALDSGFSTFERQLFHWLELTTYIDEQTDLPGYRGLVRFEDVVAPDSKVLDRLLTRLCGRQTKALNHDPFDRVHRPSITENDFETVHPLLAEKVDDLAMKLGYSAASLETARNPDDLVATYSKKRYDLSCDPTIPVLAPSESEGGTA